MSDEVESVSKRDDQELVSELGTLGVRNRVTRRVVGVTSGSPLK